jgi:hypothetical protein
MGLLRGAARVAVVAGTATAVSNRVARRQGNRWAQQDQAASEQQPAYVEPAQAPAQDDMLDQLAKLGQLHDSGVLTDEEFETQKTRILGS